MIDPNSLLTRLRRRLAARVEPGPDAGEAWCVDCELNHGRTTVLPADGTSGHLEIHRRHLPEGKVKMQSAWPHTAREGS